MIRAAAVAIVALVSLAAVQSWRLHVAQIDRDAAQEMVRGYQDAARIHAAHAAKIEAARAEAAALDRELQEGVGADAALSDYLRHGAGRVWP